MDPVTLEQVQAEAKKLGITLSDEQAKAHVTLNSLPVKESAPSPGDNDDDDDELDLDDLGGKSDAVRKRINKLNAKHREEKKTLQKQMKENQDKLRQFEDDKKKKEREDAEAQGKHKELAEAAQAESDAAKTKLETQKAKFKDNVTNTELRDALRSAGCPSDKLSKAMKLVETDDIVFDWTNEENFEFSIDGTSTAIEKFKTDWPEFFSDDESDGGSGGSSGNPNPKPPRSKKKTSEEEEKERKARLYKSFPALNRMSQS